METAINKTNGSGKHLISSRLILTCTLLSAVSGGIALFGWIAELPILTTLGSGMIPMAPSTALLFLVYGISTAVLLDPRRSSSSRIGLVTGFVSMLISLLLLVLSSLGIHPKAEHLGLNISGAINGAPVGHMSPLTAFCFLLAGYSFIMSLLRSRPRTAGAAFWSSVLLTLISLLLILAYLLGSPLLYGSGFIPPALPTSLAFLLLGTGLVMSVWQRKYSDFTLQKLTISRPVYVFVLIFVLLASGILSGGILYFRNYEKKFRYEAESQLSAIADLKVSELAHWREERLGDAAIFYRNSSFSDMVRSYLKAPDDRVAKERLMTWMRQLRHAYQYDRVCLHDASGTERLAYPETHAQMPGFFSGRSAEIMRTRKVSFEDFYRDETDGRVYLSVLVPLLDLQQGGHPLGVLMMRIDPERYLYPFIEKWPSLSRTSETLLVRREGNEVLFLNELRFEKNTAVRLRRPLTQKDLPAVWAALGLKQVREGIDYRGVPVIADVRPVPDSPWAIVSKMAVSEVYGPLRERLWILISLISALLIGSGAGVGFVWRQYSLRFYRERYEAAEELKQKNAELERFIYTVSHDLKSPVVTVKTFLGYLEQDLKTSDNERIEKDVNFMRTAAIKMGQLLDELLEMSRVGRVLNPPSRMKFRELVDEALSAVAGVIAEHSVKIDVRDNRIMLYGDRPRLMEIWQNLIENAVKYMGQQKEPRIEIGAELIRGETVFFVRDNGMGIDPRYNEKIFGLFEKLDPRTKGTGLGLALVKRIVELYKGRIWVESKGTEQGSCFLFTLPGAISKEDKGGQS